jgi:nucleoside-diphosphate-sugar epimerase
MQISIIGTNGFLSNAIVSYFLLKDYKLHMYGRKKPNHPFASFTLLNLPDEQPDYSKLYSSDFIIYAVGAGIQSNLKESCQLIYDLNVTVPVEICNSLKENNYKGIFVSFGSVFEMGIAQEARPFDETDILTSLAPAPGDYVISKRMLSRFIQAYKRDFTHWHFILPTIYGELENPARLIPYTIDAIKDNKPLSFTNGNQTRQYIYVNELPYIIQLAYDKKLPDGIYNIEGNETLTVRQIVKLIHDVFGQQIPDDCFGKAIRTDTGMHYLALNGQKLNSFIQFKPTHKIEDILKKY